MNLYPYIYVLLYMIMSRCRRLDKLVFLYQDITSRLSMFEVYVLF